MSTSILTFIVFGSLIILLFSGLPILYVLGGMSSIGGLLLLDGSRGAALVANQVYGQMDNFVTVAIPLFIFLGTILERAGIAEDAFDLMYKTLGRMRGGLAVGAVIVCTIFAAMTGTAAAATISMGLIALPAMLKRKYNLRLAMGCIAASGTLGVVIPPSVLMVLYSLFANESVGKMFAGGVLPGIGISVGFILYIIIRSYIQKDFCPAVPKEERPGFIEVLKATKSLIFPIIIIVAVLGSIFAGIATPTEAAAVGCVGAIICAKLRGTLNWKLMKQTCYKTLELTAMVVWIIFASASFSAFFNRIGVIEFVANIFVSIPASKYVVITIIMAILLVMGMFMDPGAIIMLTTPIFVPVVTGLGFDTLWFGVLFIINMIIGYISPPFGFNLFYMKQIVPEGVGMAEIYKSVVPFIAIMIACLALYIAFPQIILYLPNRLIM